MTLYGFATVDERALFDLLTGVTGVGPKVALSFLSALQPTAIRRAIAAGDADALTVVPGVGIGHASEVTRCVSKWSTFTRSEPAAAALPGSTTVVR